MSSAVQLASKKPPLLFLAHRIPYPPNKGDKIRSYHLLKYLAEHFSVYLGTFVDDEEDWKYCPDVRRYCCDAFFVPRNRRIHKLLALRGLLSGQALSVAYYASRSMQHWVDHIVVTHSIDRALMFCSPMMQFVTPQTFAGQKLNQLVVDFVDMDSEKWRQYAEDGNGPTKWLYQREAARLLEFECFCAQLADTSYFVSPEEALLFRSRIAGDIQGIGHFLNGVDADYFKPGATFESPYCDGSQVLVFTGAMDYRPNIDAVIWFAKEVFPSVRAANPNLEFWIVGGKPAEQVMALSRCEGVEVTGRVEDVRPYLQHAIAAVAPMHIARGIQNKVLEAMAMGKRVIASPEAVEGIGARDGQHLYVCETPSDYAAAIALLNTSDTSDISETSRLAVSFVTNNFRWESQLATVVQVLAEQ